MAENERKSGSIQAYERGWMITLGVIIVLGALILSGVTLTRGDPASAFGVAALLAGSCLLIGGLIGFLFGIPRALQGDGHEVVEHEEAEKNEPATSSDNVRRRRAAYRANTNLEQISDWLTKILVGVGLTQIGDAPGELLAAAEYLGPALGGGVGAERLAVGIMLYFPTAGFFFGYLWTRLFLAGALARADLEAALAAVEKQVQEQPQFDAAALASVQQYLTDPATRVSAADVKNAIQKASPMVKVQIFYLAKKIRKESVNKTIMERTIPIFEALIESDAAGSFHKNHGQLGYVLKDKETPDYAQAEASLSRAIKIRGPWQQTGWTIYEGNRAICRIEQDAEFKQQPSKPSTQKNRARIIEDLKAVAATEDLASWLEQPPFSDWMKLNGVTLESLETEW